MNMTTQAERAERMHTQAWSGGKCRVPMWMMGCPAGHCDDEAFGPQLPAALLVWERGWRKSDVPYCQGPCCPAHGGPKAGNPILFRDGTTEAGRPMWCAVMPDFEDLQASPAGFDGDPRKAISNLRAAIARAEGRDNG